MTRRLLSVFALFLATCGDDTVPERCGNGRLDPGESCDGTAAFPCPTSCDACEELTGGLCQAECTPIETHVADDGCCGEGEDATSEPACAAVCGNGVVEAGESCDTAIAAGDPGACPTSESCDDLMACTADSIGGVGCQAACANDPITAVGAADLCCPTGADASSDPDCPTGCGNGVVDPGETCDTAIATGDGACPVVCNDGDACTTDSLVSAGTCTDTCTSVADVTPAPGDDCCPAGANANTDTDCPSTCGNGALEPGEDCDTAIPAGAAGSCPQSAADCADADACTTEAFVGAACAARCQVTTITVTGTADGCCPAAGNANNDPDCLAVCGNGVVESTAGESCDIALAGSCPTSAAQCNDSNACTTDSVTGTGCGTTCAHADVTTCSMTIDGCCPAGCTGLVDADCSLTCGDGVVQSNETCDTGPGSPTPCPATAADCADGDDCTTDAVQSAGTCNATCVHATITAPATGDDCCPPGENANTDGDCDAVCNNGVVEPGENCDPVATCPTSCNDGIACTSDSVQNAGTCQAACAFTPITPCCGNGVVEGGETCDTASVAGCPDNNAECSDGNACTTDTVNNPSTCTATCSNTPFTPCCGDGVVTSPETLTETCDDGPGTTRACSTITCADNYACTTDTPVFLGGNACRKICAHTAVNTAGDLCCPPQSRSTDDSDCMCGNAVTDMAAFEQCDDGNTINQGDMCTNSCTIDNGLVVGSPCTADADCMFPGFSAGTRCVLPATLPPLTSGVVNGYCSVVLCDATTTDTDGDLIPQNLETCPQAAAPPTFNAVCVELSPTAPTLCVALCNPAQGDAQCRRTESNPALGAAGSYAYRCVPTSPTSGICLPRDPTY